MANFNQVSKPLVRSRKFAESLNDGLNTLLPMNPSTASYVETLKNILKEEHLTAALLWLNENASET